MKEMNLFTNEQLTEKAVLLAGVGSSLCRVLNLEEDEDNNVSLGAAYVNFNKHREVSILTLLAELHNSLIPVDFIHFLKNNEFLKDKMFMSSQLILHINGFLIKVRIFWNVSQEFMANRRLSFTISDMSYYAFSFIHLDSLEKLSGSKSLSSIRGVLDHFAANYLLVFEAGYLFGVEYNAMREHDLFIDLPERLCCLYVKELGAVNVNQVIGNNEESITMCIFPNNVKSGTIRQRLQQTSGSR